LTIILSYGLGRGLVRSTSFLIGMVVGTMFAFIIGQTNFSEVANAGWYGLPTPLIFGFPSFDFTSSIIMCLAMIVILIEVTADFLAVGEMVDKEITDQDITRGIFADGLATIIGGIMNTFPYCAYNENVGLIAISGVKSRWVVAFSGLFLIILGFIPKVASIFALMPLPVLGGAALAMFSMIAVTGINILSKVDFSRGENTLIVAISIGLGL